MRTLTCIVLFLGCWVSSLSAASVLLDVQGESYPIPVKVYLPTDLAEPAPVVFFSHGLGGSREGNVYLGEHWSAVGYVVVFVQHPGSDKSVWEDAPLFKRGQALKSGASAEQFFKRINDVKRVLDHLEDTETELGRLLEGKVNTERMAMAGHSFGAVTSQALMGQRFENFGVLSYIEERFDCFILMSPSQSTKLSDAKAFAGVKAPALCMTGTKDTSPIRKEVTAESRQLVYANIGSKEAYQVVFDKGAHSIFGDYRKNDARYHKAILPLTTAFLDTYLKDDAAARVWLRGEEVREVLVPKDLWQVR